MRTTGKEKKDLYLLVGNGTYRQDSWLLRTSRRPLLLGQAIKAVEDKVGLRGMDRSSATFDLVAVQPELALDIDEPSE